MNIRFRYYTRFFHSFLIRTQSIKHFTLIRFRTASLALLLLGIALLTYSCGTARRLEIEKTKSSPSIGKVESPKVKGAHNEAKLIARKVRAISNLELSSLQFIEKGTASWYGSEFQGQLTASGERYDMHSLTAAHRTLPFNTIILVKNMNNGKTVVVRVNDRGPFVDNRIIDLSKKAARKLGMLGAGTTNVRLFTLDEALAEESIENIKVATYTIQLGSYDNEAQAFEHAAKVRGARVEVAFLDNEKVFRVYYGLYASKERAGKVCDELGDRSIEGYVKQVENEWAYGNVNK